MEATELDLTDDHCGCKLGGESEKMSYTGVGRQALGTSQRYKSTCRVHLASTRCDHGGVVEVGEVKGGLWQYS